MTGRWIGWCCVLLVLAAVPARGDELQEGTPDLQSAGPIAFGPNGVLFIADPRGAAIFAVDTEDAKGSPEQAEINVEDVQSLVAGALGTTSGDVLVNDMAVNLASGVAYLSVSRGRGPEGTPVILKIDGQGEVSELSLENVKFAKAELPNAPEDKIVGEGRRRGNPRMESITDLAFVDGKLFIAGLSNEEFASKLRSIPYPFEQADEGASIEIYHGSHGAYETRSPVRTFAVVDVDDAPHLLAAYTCTPLVKIPVAMLKPGEKVRGETIAELGNHNRPLDMIVYEKDGAGFILMANSARGLMKMPVEKVDEIEAITERIEDTAGLPYETVEFDGSVGQLDRLNSDHALLLTVTESGEAVKLVTLELP